MTLKPVDALYLVHCNLDMLVEFGVGSSDYYDFQAIQGRALSAQPHQAEMQGCWVEFRVVCGCLPSAHSPSSHELDREV
jgi:hypothetical protein